MNQAISSLVTFSNVSFGYTSNYLLKDISFELNSKELVVLSGGNGCGKSTLLELILGRLQPQSGTIQVFKKNPCTIQRMPEIGLISEPFHREYSSLPTELTGWEIQEWLEILDNISKDSFLEMLDSLSVSPKLCKRKIESFSKGERQRFLTAVVLLRHPQLLLADEPLEGLDVESRKTIGEQLRNFVNHGGTVLWISHHLDESLLYADRFFKLENKHLSEIQAESYTVHIPLTPPVPLLSLQQLPFFIEDHWNGKSISLTISRK